MHSTASPLTVLRRNLTALGSARRRARWLTAWSAVATVAVAAVLVFWALDLLFDLSVGQRFLMLLAAAGSIGATYWKLARPLLGIRESEIELALRVERHQDIDSDLVAALQFDDPRAVTWGSPQLESAVVQYVGDFGGKLDVFAGSDNELLRRRLSWLGAHVLTMLLLVAVFPGHARALLDRLLLGHRHYPTRTVVELVIVNQQEVLERTADGTAPRAARAAQSHPVRFWIQCSGQLPNQAQLRLTGESTRAVRQLELIPLSIEERRERLESIAEELERVATGQSSPPSGTRLTDTLASLRMDVRRAAALWPTDTADAQRWRKIADHVREALQEWPRTAAATAVYQGELGRLVDSISYKLSAGDAWTDPATLTMIALPVIEPNIVVRPPDYAAAAAVPSEVGARQFSVLEGSTLDVGLSSTNHKPLSAAWLSWQTPRGPESIALRPVDDRRLAWRLPEADSPFTRIRQEVRFELQVRDDDQLQLELPISAVVRIRADRPPTASLDVVHRVILPAARPKLEYRVNDDYGISRIVLHVAVEPGQNGQGRSGEQAGSLDSEGTAVKQHERLLLEPGVVLGAAELPRLASYELDLRPLGLKKGDRIKLSLEALDHRGAEPGVSIQSDPVYLEISDESGVLAAILEADQRSEQRLTEIIKRQLGIGESP